MGLFDFILGDKIQRCVTAYDNYKAQLDPRDEPQTILANVLLNFKYKSRRFDPEVQRIAMAEALQFSCLPYPDNARAMAYFVFWQTDPTAFNRDPKNEAKYVELMQPFIKARESNTLDKLYARYNPNLASKRV